MYMLGDIAEHLWWIVEILLYKYNLHLYNDELMFNLILISAMERNVYIDNKTLVINVSPQSYELPLFSRRPWDLFYSNDLPTM